MINFGILVMNLSLDMIFVYKNVECNTELTWYLFGSSEAIGSLLHYYFKY
jgi:hypothetical protein